MQSDSTSRRHVLENHQSSVQRFPRFSTWCHLNDGGHHRLSGTTWKTWENAEHYFDDFLERAGDSWNHSAFEDIKVVDSSKNKVHLDAEIRRYDSSDVLITSFRSLWIIIELDGVWAAKARSSFAQN